MAKYTALSIHRGADKRFPLDTDEVISVLRERPGTQHVVITGRNAPEKLVDFADLVTDMSKVKHPMDAGQKGQRGIEW